MRSNITTFGVSTIVLSMAFVTCLLSDYFGTNPLYQTYILGMIAIAANIFQIRSFLVENRERGNREKENKILLQSIEKLKRELDELKGMQLRQMSVEQLINHIKSRIIEISESNVQH